MDLGTFGLGVLMVLLGLAVRPLGWMLVVGTVVIAAGLFHVLSVAWPYLLLAFGAVLASAMLVARHGSRRFRHDESERTKTYRTPSQRQADAVKAHPATPPASEDNP